MFDLGLTFQSTVTVVARLGRASTFCGTAILDWGAIWNPFLLQHSIHVFLILYLYRRNYSDHFTLLKRNRSALAVSCEVTSAHASDLSAYNWLTNRELLLNNSRTKAVRVGISFWSGNLFLIAPFPDRCLLVPFYQRSCGCQGNVTYEIVEVII